MMFCHVFRFFKKDRVTLRVYVYVFWQTAIKSRGRETCVLANCYKVAREGNLPKKSFRDLLITISGIRDYRLFSWDPEYAEKDSGIPALAPLPRLKCYKSVSLRLPGDWIECV